MTKVINVAWIVSFATGIGMIIADSNQNWTIFELVAYINMANVIILAVLLKYKDGKKNET